MVKALIGVVIIVWPVIIQAFHYGKYIKMDDDSGESKKKKKFPDSFFLLFSGCDRDLLLNFVCLLL